VHLTPHDIGVPPAGPGRVDDERHILYELESEVETELAEDEASEPAEDPDGTPTEAWFEDPYLPQYEVGLRALHDAVEGLTGNHGSDGRPAPSATAPPEE
jgi:hypothetical protein